MATISFFSRGFSAALCRGLIEALVGVGAGVACYHGFPRLYAAASLKRERGGAEYRHGLGGFPRLYAAASLKLRKVPGRILDYGVFSAALCRGLIAAGSPARAATPGCHVFRGSMPRPH